MGTNVSQSPLDSDEKSQWQGLGELEEQQPLDDNEKLQWKGEEAQEEQDASTAASPTSSTASSASSWSGGAESTLIIFDWDDTLLCSSALDTMPRNSPILRQLEATVDMVLRTAMRLGETIIVTNGCSTWVQESSRAYLPGLVPTLEKLSVTSARALYEHLHPADPSSWKRRAFRKILQQKRAEGHDGLNLVVIGDQSAEMTAVHAAAKVLRGPSPIKTIKFVEGPSVEQLMGQLRKVAQELSGIVCQERSSSTDLTQRRLPANEMEAWATGWAFSLGKDWSKFPGVLRPQEDEDEDDGGIVELEEVREFGLYATTIEESDHEEIRLIDPFARYKQKARRPSRTPVCALCSWGQDLTAHEHLQEQLQVLSI